MVHLSEQCDGFMLRKPRIGRQLRHLSNFNAVVRWDVVGRCRGHRRTHPRVDAFYSAQHDVDHFDDGVRLRCNDLFSAAMLRTNGSIRSIDATKYAIGIGMRTRDQSMRYFPAKLLHSILSIDKFAIGVQRRPR